MENKEQTEVFRIAVKVPPFWPEKIKLWFHQLEAQFISAGITQDSTKYGYVIANLNQKYVEEKEDILEEPLTKRKYEGVKMALIKIELTKTSDDVADHVLNHFMKKNCAEEDTTQ